MAAKLAFSGKLTKSDPKENPVLIVGQLKFLKQIKFSDVSLKLEPRVNEEVSLCDVDHF
jgi:probable aminopeptidase NPEPL1